MKVPERQGRAPHMISQEPRWKEWSEASSLGRHRDNDIEPMNIEPMRLGNPYVMSDEDMSSSGHKPVGASVVAMFSVL